MALMLFHDLWDFIWTILSFLGRANYSYNDKYLFTLVGRYDLVPYVIKASGSILLGNPQRDFS